MFGLPSKKTILYLDESTVSAFKVDTSGSRIQSKPQTAQWANKTFVAALTAINKKLGLGKVRILLSERVSYTSVLSIPVQDIGDREKVKEAAQEMIPENLDKAIWDYSVVEQDIGDAQIQVIAMTEEVSVNVQKALGVIKSLDIEAILPIGVALAQLTSKETHPHVIIHESEAIVVAHKGHVYTTQIPANKDVEAQLGEVLAFASTEYGLEVKKIFLSTSSNDEDSLDISIQDSRIIKALIDPFAQLALKKDLTGRDEKILNLEVTEFSTKLSKESKKKSSRNNTGTAKVSTLNPRLLKALIVVVIISVAIIGITIINGGYISPELDTADQETERTTITNSEAISATSSEEIFATKIQVRFVASSVELATDLTGGLLEEGYLQVDMEEIISSQVGITGQRDENIPIEVSDKVEELLGIESVTFSYGLTPDSTYDLVILVGQIN